MTQKTSDQAEPTLHSLEHRAERTEQPGTAGALPHTPLTHTALAVSTDTLAGQSSPARATRLPAPHTLTTSTAARALAQPGRAVAIAQVSVG